MIAGTDLEEILDRTRPLWQEMRGQRLFLTGGTGFFGQWLTASFLHCNERLGLDARLVVLSRQAKHSDHPALSYRQGDVRSFDFPDGAFSHVIHAATTSAAETFHGEPPEAKIDTVVTGTRRVLDFAGRCGTRKFLLTSSGNAYGPMPAGQQAFRETDLCGPDLEQPAAAALGEAKRLAELITRIEAGRGGFEAKICRCFSFIGAHLPLDIHYAMGNFIRDALAGGPVVVQGDGSAMRSWLYMTDLTVWLWTLLFRGTPNRLYNVGSGEATSVGEAARRVAERCGVAVEFLRRPETRPSASPNIYVPDVRRIGAELGLERTVDLAEAIDRTLAAHRVAATSPR